MEWPKLAPLFSLLSAGAQVFLIYLALCRRSRGPVHRGFVAILASLALWNLGNCLIFLDRSSQTLHVLAFLGVLAAGPSALLFAAAFAERRLRGVTLGYWIASFSALFLILNPNNLTWRDGEITNLWRGYVLGYLVLFVGGALAVLLSSLPSAQGKVRRRHYAYLLLISLLGFAGGLTELLSGLDVRIPPVGGLSTALWSILLGYAILRHRLIALPLERRAILGYVAGLALVLALGLTAAYRTRQLETVILALAVLPLLYFIIANRLLPGLSLLGMQPKAQPLQPDQLRQEYGERLAEVRDAGRVAAAWQAFAAGLFPEARCRLVQPEEDSRRTLEKALAEGRRVHAGECLQREALEHEAFLSGRHNPVGRASHELWRVLADHEADVLSVLPGRPEAPWLALSSARAGTLSLSDEEARTLRALAQETAAAVARLELLDQLRRADRLSMAGSIAARVAHEVKNPLGAIAGAVQVLQQQLPDDQGSREFLGMIADEVRRLDRIVRDYLQFARPRPPEPTAVELRPLVQRILAGMKTQPDWAVQVEWDWPEPDPPVLADAEQLAQVLHNLLNNAFEAMSGGGRLRLLGRMENLDGRPGFQLEMSDSGRGMDAATLARAFDPFFTTRARGSGLGLAIARDLVEGMGGRISVSSTPGAGTTVTLWLPRQEPV